MFVYISNPAKNETFLTQKKEKKKTELKLAINFPLYRIP